MLLAASDPNLFHLNWDRLYEVLVTIVVLAFFVERALALFFENRRVIPFLAKSGRKEWIALAVSLVICIYWEFDAVSMIVLKGKTNIVGYVVTAAVIAGGSKAAIKLFRDVMGIKSTALKEYEASSDAALKKAAADKKEAPKKKAAAVGGQ